MPRLSLLLLNLLALALGKSELDINKWLAEEHNFTLRSITKLEAVLGEEILTVVE